MTFTFSAATAESTVAICKAIVAGIDGRHNEIANVRAEAASLGELAAKYARFIANEPGCVGVNVSADEYTAGQVELLRLFSVPTI